MTTTASAITPREREVLRLMAAGLQPKQIADALSLSVRTIECHRFNILRKTHCKNSFQLGVWAVRSGLAPGDGWSPVRECVERIPTVRRRFYAERVGD